MYVYIVFDLSPFIIYGMHLYLPSYGRQASIVIGQKYPLWATLLLGNFCYLFGIIWHGFSVEAAAQTFFISCIIISMKEVNCSEQ